MDFSNLGLFKLITRRIDWLSQRQEILARNIANADTPGYRPLDIGPFAEHLAGLGIQVFPGPVFCLLNLAGGVGMATETGFGHFRSRSELDIQLFELAVIGG